MTLTSNTTIRVQIVTGVGPVIRVCGMEKAIAFDPVEGDLWKTIAYVCGLNGNCVWWQEAPRT